jgi:hypothetical protein
LNELTGNTFQSGMTNLTIHDKDDKGTSEWNDCDYTYDYDYDDESYDEDSLFRASINRRPSDEDIEASKHWYCPAFDKLMEERIRKSKLPKPKRNENEPKQWGWKGVGVWGCPDNSKMVQEPQQPQCGWRS